jgi:hypothetical protein
LSTRNSSLPGWIRPVRRRVVELVRSQRRLQPVPLPRCIRAALLEGRVRSLAVLYSAAMRIPKGIAVTASLMLSRLSSRCLKVRTPGRQNRAPGLVARVPALSAVGSPLSRGAEVLASCGHHTPWTVYVLASLFTEKPAMFFGFSAGRQAP